MTKIKIYSIVIVLLLTCCLIEFLSYAVLKLDKITNYDNEDYNEFVAFNNMNEAQSGPFTPNPYFGYTYVPDNTFTQINPSTNRPFTVTSNSSGFPDKEFPKTKDKNLFVIGLIGGSGAMSWGVDEEADRISNQLETHLNLYATTNNLKIRYRVLNMGIGSYIQYQASSAFIYYHYLLDGVINYTGHNEIAHAHILSSNRPIRFPLFDVTYSDRLIKKNSISNIFELRKKIANTSNHCLSWFNILNLSTLRLYCDYKISNLQKSIDKINYDFQNNGSTYSNIKYPSDPLRDDLPIYSQERIFFSYKMEDEIYKAEIMDKIIKYNYTQSIIDIHAIAKNSNILFLNVIQPMVGATMKNLSRFEVEEIINHPNAKKFGLDYNAVAYIKYGIKILREQSSYMKEHHNIYTYDLNSSFVFHNIHESTFMDPVHLNKLGANLVSKAIFEELCRVWGFPAENGFQQN